MNNERILRRVRQRIFDYPAGFKSFQANRVLCRLMARVLAARPPEPRDRQGLTRSDRAALRRHNILPTDL